MSLKILVLSVVLMISACSSAPTVFNTEIPSAPTIDAVMADGGEQFAGQRVRWGGEIISIKNQTDETWVEVLHRPLKSSGRPKDSASEGRFYVKVAGFLEPKEYEEGTAFTAVGELSGYVTQKVGEFDYRYPVINVEKANQRIWSDVKTSPSYWHMRSALYLDFPWVYSPYRHFGTRIILIKDTPTE